MATRIIVLHDDGEFVEALADTLRADGCDVVIGADPNAKIPAPRIAGALELTASQSKGRYPGVRIRQICIRKEQVAQVRRSLAKYQKLKAAIEQICEINLQLLRDDPKGEEGKRGK